MSCSRAQFKFNPYNQLTQLEENDKKKQCPIPFQSKNEDDFDHIQNTSPTQNLVTDDSTIFNEQKRRCGFCIQIQKKMQTVQYQLQRQKKKNAKYLKIMNKRIDKQRELHQAYYQIAKELKKKIQVLSSCQARHNNQIQQVRIIKQQFKDIDLQGNKQIQRQGLMLESKNIDLQIYSKRLNHFVISHFQIYKYIIQGQYESLLSDEIQVQKFLQNKQRSLQSSQKQFQKFEDSKIFHSINNSQISKSFLQFANQRLNPTQQNKSKRQSSYYSVDPQLSINEISNVLMKNSMSNQQIDRNIEKQLLQSLSPSVSQKHQRVAQNVLQYSFKEEQLGLRSKKDLEKKDREELIIFIKNIRGLLDTLGKQLSAYGQKYNIYYRPSIMELQFVQQQSKPLEDLLTKSNIESLLKQLLEQQQKLFRSFRRQYEKMLNDKELELYDLKTKISELSNQKGRYQQIIQKYQIHKTMLSIKILDLEQALSKKNKQLTSQIIFKKEGIVKVEHQQIQCQIIAQEVCKINQSLSFSNRRLTNALNYIPIFISKINPKKYEQSPIIINYENKLEDQLQLILTQYLKNVGCPQTNEKIEKEYLVIENQFPIKLARTDSTGKLIDLLQRENQELKDTLKSKSQQLLKYSQKVSLYKMQKSILDKNIQSLSIQIQHLNAQLQQQKTPLKSSISINCPQLQNSEFKEYNQKREYNNLNWDRQQELKESKLKIQAYQSQLAKLKHNIKKNKKIVYINK